MSNKNLDPTLAALLIGAISTLILKIRIKRRKKTTEGESEFTLDFSKLTPEQQAAVKEIVEQKEKGVDDVKN